MDDWWFLVSISSWFMTSYLYPTSKTAFSIHETWNIGGKRPQELFPQICRQMANLPGRATRFPRLLRTLEALVLLLLSLSTHALPQVNNSRGLLCPRGQSRWVSSHHKSPTLEISLLLSAPQYLILFSHKPVITLIMG